MLLYIPFIPCSLSVLVSSICLFVDSVWFILSNHLVSLVLYMVYYYSKQLGMANVVLEESLLKLEICSCRFYLGLQIFMCWLWTSTWLLWSPLNTLYNFSFLVLHWMALEALFKGCWNMTRIESRKPQTSCSCAVFFFLHKNIVC